MAGKQRAALEEKARGLLSGMGMGHVTVVEPLMGRPMPARLEIVHPCWPGERGLCGGA
jgi:hypothetical protein